MTCEVARGAAPRMERLAAAILLTALAAVPLIGSDLVGAAAAPCLFKGLTGLPCGTCGCTRAAAALLRGDFAGAITLQPLGAGAAAAGGALTALWSAVTLAGTRLRLRLTVGEGLRVRLVAGYLLLVNWVYLIENGI